MGLLKRLRELEVKVVVLETKKDEFEEEFKELHAKEKWAVRVALSVAGSILVLTIALVAVIVKFQL